MSKSDKDNNDDGPTEMNIKFLEMLVCPLTQTVLEFDRDKQVLVSNAAKLAYPIRDGIPIMLPSEASALED